MAEELLLPYLDRERILAFYRRAPGNEIDIGKFASPVSSARLAANFLGYFLDDPVQLCSLLGIEVQPAGSVLELERCLHFPWRGGRHPWLDAVVETERFLIGIEAKRYEPFRSAKAGVFSDAYWSFDWGSDMSRFCAMRDAIRDGSVSCASLDATQLVKHAYGLATQARKFAKIPVLVYLHAEPVNDDNGRAIHATRHLRHRAEADAFMTTVAGDFVEVRCTTYAALMAAMSMTTDPARLHAKAITAKFGAL